MTHTAKIYHLNAMREIRRDAVSERRTRRFLDSRAFRCVIAVGMCMMMAPLVVMGAILGAALCYAFGVAWFAGWVWGDDNG